MSRSESPPGRPLPVSNRTVLAVVAVIVVAGTLLGLGAFYLFGDAEEVPDADVQLETYGEDDRHLRFYHDGGERIEDPDTVAITVNDEWVGNNTGRDWADSDDGIGEGSEVFLAWNDTRNAVVLGDERDDPSFDGGVPAGNEIEVIWSSATTDSAARLYYYEVE